MDYRILLRRTIILLLVLLLTGCGTATMASPPATQIPIAASPSPTAAPPTKTSEPPPLGTLTMSPSGCTLDLAEDTVTPGAYAIVCQDFIDPAGWWPVYIAGPIEVE